MNFIDQIKVTVRSGKGGDGIVHFMRTKQNPKAGPDGGDGGRGGHIILKGNKHLWTLLHLRYRKHIIAPDGQNGSDRHCSGKNGADIIIEVPIGTIAKDAHSNATEAEILEHEQSVIWIKGGRGGKGNAFFKRPTLQAPPYAMNGEERQEGLKILELKLLADVGLVGFPNAGKSTLLSVLSQAKPKIADYPFTTLVPQLGIVAYKDNLSFCMADLPGIIAGASEGKGLGHRFLRHIERNSLLLLVIPIDAAIQEVYNILISELTLYNPELLDKKRMLALTKSDLLSETETAEKLRSVPAGIPYILISAVQKKGLAELKNLIWGSIDPLGPLTPSAGC